MSEQAWFETWFDSDYYHTLYKHRDDAEAQRFIDNVVSHIDIDRNSKLLDLACGKGRHSIYLASKGFDVVGMDLSPNSINHAKQFEKDNLHFEVHDMREPAGDEEFDGILNLFTSFGYFDDESDNERVIRSMSTALKPGGFILIDFMNADKVMSNLVPAEMKTIDGIDFDITRHHDDLHIYKHIKIRDRAETYEYTERVQAITKEKLVPMVDAAGFENAQVFGNYDLAPFNSEESDRLIVIAYKPK